MSHTLPHFGFVLMFGTTAVLVYTLRNVLAETPITPHPTHDVFCLFSVSATYRRRPTVFDLFPDMGDETSPLDEGGGGNTPAGTPATGLRDSLKHAPVGARESIKTETGRLLGLMTKFLERGDDNKGDSSNNAMAAGDDEVIFFVFVFC